MVTVEDSVDWRVPEKPTRVVSLEVEGKQIFDPSTLVYELKIEYICYFQRNFDAPSLDYVYDMCIFDCLVDAT